MKDASVEHDEAMTARLASPVGTPAGIPDEVSEGPAVTLERYHMPHPTPPHPTHVYTHITAHTETSPLT